MPQDEIDKLCALVIETFSVSEKSSDCASALRQLVFILHVSVTEPSFPKKLILLMLNSVSSSAKLSPSKKKQCLLCSDIIRELLPDSGLDLQEGQAPLTPNKSVDYLPLYLMQGRTPGCIEKILPLAIRWLTEQKLESDVQKKIFTFLVGVESLHRHMLSQDEISKTSKKAAHWLMNASLYQAVNPYTYNPFKKDQSMPVNEIDGTPSRNFYSVLNVGQYLTDDQLLNIFTFSLLYKWLINSDPPGEDVSGETTLSNKHYAALASLHGSLVHKTVDYCFRLLDQCERKPKVPQDTELQNACLLEAVRILDLVCRVDNSQVPKVFQEVKRLFARLSQDASHPRILLQIIQFFLNHSAEVVHDPQQAFDLYFGRLLSDHFRIPALAYETVQFIRDNLETLCYKTNILRKFFPNILKILAWNPRTFVSEFMDIIPAIMSPSSSLEVLHSILDLPCICAALEVAMKTDKGDITPAAASQSSGQLSSLEAYKDPLDNLMFKFITRVEGGQGDTINRLNVLHSLLKDMSEHARVIVCGQIVPVLLKEYFTVMKEEGDLQLANRLFPVLLERAGMLYDIPEYQTDVRRIFAESLYQLFRDYPQIVVDQHSEIMDYITSTRNITDKELFFSNLVWGIGEFCSAKHDKRCTSEMISKYYEALEALTYETSGLIQSAASEERSPFSPRLVTMLISALAKLSTRCQDLIPRVLLCLTKVSQQQLSSNLEPETKEALVDRAQQLINLLKLPNFASVILNPSSDIESGRWHTDHTSEAVILRTTHRILRPDP